MRAYFEELETHQLAPYSVKSHTSKGRDYPEEASATRTCFQRDRDRVIHAKAFRRLKHKTQVFVAMESDHYRSRLIHTLEVAQISRHISRLLRLNEDLAEVIALAHDLGHPPFGHSGEAALDTLLQAHGGFEHNIQSRRVVDHLEKTYPNFDGLNLSFEVREGLIKHSSPWDHPPDTKAYVTLEAQLVNLADEIAYNNHDLDDGLNATLLHDEALTHHVTLWRDAKKVIQSRYASLTAPQQQHLIISYLISVFIHDVITTTQRNLQDASIQSVEDIQTLASPLVSFSSDLNNKNRELRDYLYTHFYQTPQIVHMNQDGQSIITYLYTTYLKKPELLPPTFQDALSYTYPKERIIADYIAGMTDTYAKDAYTKLHSL